MGISSPPRRAPGPPRLGAGLATPGNSPPPALTAGQHRDAPCRPSLSPGLCLLPHAACGIPGSALPRICRCTPGRSPTCIPSPPRLAPPAAQAPFTPRRSPARPGTAPLHPPGRRFWGARGREQPQGPLRTPQGCGGQWQWGRGAVGAARGDRGATGGQRYPHVGPVGAGAWGAFLDRNGLWGEAAARAGGYGAGTGGDGGAVPPAHGAMGCGAVPPGGVMLWPWGNCGDPCEAAQKGHKSRKCPMSPCRGGSPGLPCKGDSPRHPPATSPAPKGAAPALSTRRAAHSSCPFSPPKEKDSMSPACPAARTSTPSLV